MTWSAAATTSPPAPKVVWGRSEELLYEDYYGLAETPFSLTPDPKYLYKSESHASAFELLQYALRRREGFIVVTGDIGTGKTTLCRAVMGQLDRRTFTALVSNPLLTETDLLRLVVGAGTCGRAGFGDGVAATAAGGGDQRRLRAPLQPRSCNAPWRTTGQATSTTR